MHNNAFWCHLYSVGIHNRNLLLKSLVTMTMSRVVILLCGPIYGKVLQPKLTAKKYKEDLEKKWWKVDIRTMKKLLAVGKACKAIFWSAPDFKIKRRTFVILRVQPRGSSSSSSSSDWILMSCQLHRVTSGQSNSGHKQIHISKLFSHIITSTLYQVNLQNQSLHKHKTYICKHQTQIFEA